MIEFSEVLGLKVRVQTVLEYLSSINPQADSYGRFVMESQSSFDSSFVFACRQSKQCQEFSQKDVNFYCNLFLGFFLTFIHACTHVRSYSLTFPRHDSLVHTHVHIFHTLTHEQQCEGAEMRPCSFSGL